MSFIFAQEYHIVPVMTDWDLNTNPPGQGVSINMKNYHRCTFVVNCQTLANATCTISLYSGATQDAATSALTFDYAWMSAAGPVTTAASAAANCDVTGTVTSATSVAMTHGTYDNYLLVIEVDAKAMDIANAEEWLTMSIADAGGGTGNIAVIALLKPRYLSDASPTAIA